MVRRSAFLLLLAAGLTGCGAPISESASRTEASVNAPRNSSAPPVHQVAGTAGRTVYGNATKGPLTEATVELFALDAFGYATGSALASTQTNASGDWQISVDSIDALLVRISGGSYVDESDTNTESRRIVELAADQFLESVLLPGESTVAVTVFSQALLQKSRRETGQANFDAVFASNRLLFSEAYGFDVLSVLPANPLAPAGPDESIAYAMNAGGVANAINALSIAANRALPEYAHILAVVEDLVDCRLDGLGIGAQQVINPVLTGYQELSLEQQVLRFRNNNYAAYAQYEPTPINASRCDELGGVADTLAPVVESSAASPTFEAESPAGLTLSDEQKSALREQFVATDDRRGDLTWSIDIPPQVPLGTTSLVATVQDAWGNASQVEWQVVVADTLPPDFEVPDPVVASAQGDITLVELQQPQVSDRVSAQNQIVVTSDAPAGFPVGQTLVTWTAQDAAGNLATLTQSVTVNSIPPTVTPAPQSIEIEPGGIDFSQFFNDPDGTTLTYSIDGLPANSGLSLDPVTGILSGTPSLSDLAAQPIQLTVSAFDGQNTATVQTSLTIAPPNTPPAFAVSQSTLVLDEDFSDQVIFIEPLEVPPTEADQQVSYTVEFVSDEAQAEAPFEVLLDAEALSLTLVARPDASGDASFTLVADDGQAQQSVFNLTLDVSVAPVNDPPRAVGQNLPVELTVGETFTFDLNSRATDVDDAELEFSAVRLPAAMSIGPGGQLSGMALPADALSEEIPLSITAGDALDETVGFVVTLRVSDPDSDGDGLSDYRESLLGLDAQSPDSDDDGFGDSLEARVAIDPLEPVLFVGANGDDSQAGDTPETSLATLGELSARLSLLDANQPAVVIIEQSAQTEETLTLSGLNRSVIGSVDFSTLQSTWLSTVSPADATTLAGDDAAVVAVTDCQQCAIFDVRVEGGRGIQVSSSDIVFDQVQVVGAASSDGGGLFVDSSVVAASRMHFALNKAEQGGAVHLDALSQMDITDSVFVGNSASASGGAVTVVDSDFTAHNVLFISNTAPAAAVIDARAGNVSLSNVTAGYNQLKSLAGQQLFRCRTALLAPCGDVSTISLRDSVIAANRNSAAQAIDLADTTVLSPGVLVEPGRGDPMSTTELASSAPFAVGFSSDDSAIPDAGSRSATDAGLGGYFSESDSPFTDSGVVEPGVHSSLPLVRAGNVGVSASFTAERALFDLRAIDIRLTDDGQPTGVRRRVSVEAFGASPHARAISPGFVPGVSFTAAAAVSLGDGRYRVWVSNSFNAGQDQLLVRVDDDPDGVVVFPSCDFFTCMIVDPALPGNGNRSIGDELEAPRPPMGDGGRHLDNLNDKRPTAGPVTGAGVTNTSSE